MAGALRQHHRVPHELQLRGRDEEQQLRLSLHDALGAVDPEVTPRTRRLVREHAAAESKALASRAEQLLADEARLERDRHALEEELQALEQKAEAQTQRFAEQERALREARAALGRERESVLADQYELEARVTARRKELSALENWLADSRVRLEAALRDVADEREDIRQERLRLRKQALVDATSLEGDL